MADAIVLTRENTRQVVVVGLNILDPSGNMQFQTSATLAGTLLDLEGNAVVGCQNVPLVYVPDSDGDYAAAITLPDAVSCGVYLFEISGTNGPNNKIRIKVPAVVVDRDS